LASLGWKRAVVEEDDRAKMRSAVIWRSCCQPPTGSHVEGAEVEVEDVLELLLLQLLTLPCSMLLSPEMLSTVMLADWLEEIEFPVLDAGRAAAETGSDENAR
jgi:hypothetical protein